MKALSFMYKTIYAVFRDRLFVIALVLAVALPIGMGNVKAHTTSDYIYPKWWAADMSQRWGFTYGVPDAGTYKARIRDGLNYNQAIGTHGPNWNNIANMDLHFTENSGEWSNFNDRVCPSTRGKNGIHWRNIDGSSVKTPPNQYNQLGHVTPCVWGNNKSRLWSVNMVLDSSENWYTGIGDSPIGYWVGSPNGGYCTTATGAGCTVDLWSAAAHEWGHMFGFQKGPVTTLEGKGHYPEWDPICPEDSNRATMCPGIGPGVDAMRTLEPDDRHTIQPAYDY